jgi:diguanylate cyclase (GGDEF)-like protein
MPSGSESNDDRSSPSEDATLGDVAANADLTLIGHSLEPSEPDGAALQDEAQRQRPVPLTTQEVVGAIRPIAPPDGWTDILTGADGPRLWDRLLLSEQARVSRYHRPVTVVFSEIAGLDRLAAQWGWHVAARTLAACARRLGREIRSSDHLARLEQARFAILLTETAEIAAINFVERARASCERELTAAANDVTIGFGWASPPDGGDLLDAVNLALTRLASDLSSGPPA